MRKGKDWCVWFTAINPPTILVTFHEDRDFVSAEENGSVSISGTDGMSLTATNNPGFQVGGGVESSSKNLVLDANIQFDSANLSGLSGVFQNTGGYTGTATGSAYYKVGGKLLLGGGAYWSNQVASGTSLSEELDIAKASFNYKQIRPFVGIGYQFNRDQLLVNYSLPGIDEINGLGIRDSLKGIHSQTFTVNNEILLGTKGALKHLRLTQKVSFSSSNTNLAGFFTESNLRTSGVSAGAGLKFVL